MKANGVTCLDYIEGAGSVRFVLDCTAEQALEMDTMQVDITTDDGDLATRFVALVKVSATIDAADGRCTLLCAAATGDMAAMVAQLINRVAVVEEKASVAEGLQAQLDALAGTEEVTEGE